MPDSPNFFWNENHARESLRSPDPGLRRIAAEHFAERGRRECGRPYTAGSKSWTHDFRRALEEHWDREKAQKCPS